jgi:hypothetical protein
VIVPPAIPGTCHHQLGLARRTADAAEAPSAALRSVVLACSRPITTPRCSHRSGTQRIGQAIPAAVLIANSMFGNRPQDREICQAPSYLRSDITPWGVRGARPAYAIYGKVVCPSRLCG